MAGRGWRVVDGGPTPAMTLEAVADSSIFARVRIDYPERFAGGHRISKRPPAFGETFDPYAAGSLIDVRQWMRSCSGG